MKTTLEQLVSSNSFIWRGNPRLSDDSAGIATGFAELDAVLPAGGWPRNALIEIITAQWGIGELGLLMPVMARLTQQGNWLVWVKPPYVPYAPALANGGVELSRLVVLNLTKSNRCALWAMEQVLSAKACRMVLGWPRTCDDRAIRRLQSAAMGGDTLGILFRTREISTSPAALRLRLSRVVNHPLQVAVLKARGSWGRDTVNLVM